MIGNLVKKVFGSRNERMLKRMQGIVTQINALEGALAELSDDEFRAKTDVFRQRYADGETVDQLLPEAFAVVRETAKRVLEMRHFDVQLVGGIVLHEGKIAEMRTGEGKTLVATLPAYLNALTGSGVHIVTVNDYLARRDAAWMEPIYSFLGLTTGTITAGQATEEKRAAYAADITYGTNNEFGFDYLRDNMALSKEEQTQRKLAFAIVDEVDSILIDEARTPLIISGPTEDDPAMYHKINGLVPKLKRQEEEEGPGDYTVDEKQKQVFLTEEGHQRVEELLVQAGLLGAGESLYDAGNIRLMHYLHAGLRAHALFQRDVDYIVHDDQVMIVDEFTGRTLPGRRWSEGLHQAVEAKEGVSVQRENQTLASITFQNYFRLYDKLAGMTGTADTEAHEFHSIYSLEVMVIPTHQPMIRDDRGDLVYLTMDEKYTAVVEDIQDCYQRGQPVLVGTTSIESSEHLSKLLDNAGIKHQVLNAKHHEREAQIIAEAGRPAAITIATNMAGRGTDIVLGGALDMELQRDDLSAADREPIKAEWQQRHDQVVAAGGLHVIGTERNESRRVDNQLRGRSGRQGDPGSSRFYVSLEDNLMRIFAPDRVKQLMQRFGMQEGEAIEHPWVSRAIENAQRKVEGHNFDIRKQLLDYDSVANDQRKVIYEQRNEILHSDDISETIHTIRADVVYGILDNYVPQGSIDEQWDVAGLEEALEGELGVKLTIQQWLDEDESLNDESLRERVVQEVDQVYANKEHDLGSAVMRQLEKAVMLRIVDSLWKDHLAAMDHLRQGIHLRGYAQKNPIQEYKREAFDMFSQLLERIKHEVTAMLLRIQVRADEDVAAVEEQQPQGAMHFEHAQASALAAAGGGAAAPDPESGQSRTPYVREGRKVGRNEPCPCGSGKKYKQCHGKLS